MICALGIMFFFGHMPSEIFLQNVMIWRFSIYTAKMSTNALSSKVVDLFFFINFSFLFSLLPPDKSWQADGNLHFNRTDYLVTDHLAGKFAVLITSALTMEGLTLMTSFNQLTGYVFKSSCNFYTSVITPLVSSSYQNLNYPHMHSMQIFVLLCHSLLCNGCQALKTTLYRECLLCTFGYTNIHSVWGKDIHRDTLFILWNRSKYVLNLHP